MNNEKFYKENWKYYIDGFIDYWFKNYDYIPLEEDIKKEFKWFMYDYKNIVVDYRSKIFKKMINDIEKNIIDKYIED